MTKTRQIRKYLLDANIYGEMVVDIEIGELKEYYQSCRNIILVYGIKEIIRKGLRATPKDSKVGKAKVFTIQNESVNMFVVNGTTGNIILNPNFGNAEVILL